MATAIGCGGLRSNGSLRSCAQVCSLTGRLSDRFHRQGVPFHREPRPSHSKHRRAGQADRGLDRRRTGIRPRSVDSRVPSPEHVLASLAPVLSDQPAFVRISHAADIGRIGTEFALLSPSYMGIVGFVSR